MGATAAMDEVLTATEQQTLVAWFLEIAVGQTVEAARQFLQATSWYLEQAIQLFSLEANLVASLCRLLRLLWLKVPTLLMVRIYLTLKRRIE